MELRRKKRCYGPLSLRIQMIIVAIIDVLLCGLLLQHGQRIENLHMAP